MAEWHSDAKKNTWGELRWVGRKWSEQGDSNAGSECINYDDMTPVKGDHFDYWFFDISVIRLLASVGMLCFFVYYHVKFYRDIPEDRGGFCKRFFVLVPRQHFVIYSKWQLYYIIIVTPAIADLVYVINNLISFKGLNYCMQPCCMVSGYPPAGIGVWIFCNFVNLSIHLFIMFCITGWRWDDDFWKAHLARGLMWGTVSAMLQILGIVYFELPLYMKYHNHTVVAYWMINHIILFLNFVDRFYTYFKKKAKIRRADQEDIWQEAIHNFRQKSPSIDMLRQKIEERNYALTLDPNFDQDWIRLQRRVQDIINHHNDRIETKINEIKKELNYKAPTERPRLVTTFGVFMASIEVYNIIFYSLWLYTPHVIDSAAIQVGYIFLLIGVLMQEFGYFFAILYTFITMKPKQKLRSSSWELLEGRVSTVEEMENLN